MVNTCIRDLLSSPHNITVQTDIGYYFCCSTFDLRFIFKEKDDLCSVKTLLQVSVCFF